jgi:hypothetical protein
MFKFLLLLLIIILLPIFLLGGGIGIFLGRRIHKIKREMQGQNTRRSTGNTHYYDQTDGESVIDARRPEDRNKKIFAKEEGDYVDYEQQ